MRNEIAAQTPLGIEAKAIMDKGHLVPDEVVIGMISSALETNRNVKGFLFDGFPRTETQSKALDSLLAFKKTEISAVLSLIVSEEELVKRLLNRGLTSGRSDDTNDAIIKARIVEYHKKTSAVADYYSEFNKVKNINGEGTVDEIFAALCNEVDKYIS